MSAHFEIVVSGELAGSSRIMGGFLDLVEDLRRLGLNIERVDLDGQPLEPQYRARSKHEKNERKQRIREFAKGKAQQRAEDIAAALRDVALVPVACVLAKVLTPHIVEALKPHMVTENPPQRPEPPTESDFRRPRVIVREKTGAIAKSSEWARGVRMGVDALGFVLVKIDGSQCSWALNPDYYEIKEEEQGSEQSST